MMDPLEKHLRQIFVPMRAMAAQLASKYGYGIARLIIEASSEEPVLVDDKELALQRAETLAETLMLTTPVRATRFQEFSSPSEIGYVGFARNGAPLVCVIKGIGEIEFEDKSVTYISVAAMYKLSHNGSTPR